MTRRHARRQEAAINGEITVRVDILDADARFVTSADCAIRLAAGSASWSGALTGVEPHAHVGSGRYRLRVRGGAEATIVIQGRVRVGGGERFPFVGEGRPPVTGAT